MKWLWQLLQWLRSQSTAKWKSSGVVQTAKMPCKVPECSKNRLNGEIADMPISWLFCSAFKPIFWRCGSVQSVRSECVSASVKLKGLSWFDGRNTSVGDKACSDRILLVSYVLVTMNMAELALEFVRLAQSRKGMQSLSQVLNILDSPKQAVCGMLSALTWSMDCKDFGKASLEWA